MTVKWSHVDWSFNAEAFAEALSGMTPDDMQAAAELLGVSWQTIRRWQKGEYDTEFNFPRMSNFLNLCNLMDLDPRDYFTL